MSDLTFTTVFTASSFEEAHIVAGFLESEGIKARVPGAGFVDEFGMAKRMAGFAEVTVLTKDVEAAKDIVAAWKDRAPLADGEMPEGEVEGEAGS